VIVVTASAAPSITAVVPEPGIPASASHPMEPQAEDAVGGFRAASRAESTFPGNGRLAPSNALLGTNSSRRWPGCARTGSTPNYKPMTRLREFGGDNTTAPS